MTTSNFKEDAVLQPEATAETDMVDVGPKRVHSDKLHGSQSVIFDDSAVRACVDSIIELLELFGFDSKGYSPARAYSYWVQHAKVCGWMKWAKYKLAAFFAFHTQQDLPAKPTNLPDNPGDLLSGRAQRWIRLYLRSATFERRMELLTSVLQLKKGLPRPDKDALETAAKDTFAALTLYKPPVREVEVKYQGQCLTLTFEQLLKEVRATARETAVGKRFDASEAVTQAYMPSLSANYNNVRSVFGTLGHLRSAGYLRPDDIAPQFREIEWWREEHIGAPRDSPPGTSWQITNYEQLKAEFTDCYFRVLNDAVSHEEPLTQLVSLAEALKVRVISKGPALTYFCLKPLQKFMWSTLVANPIFQLIGAPVTETVLNNVLGAGLEPDEAYLSGDYKAATDNLRGELSEAFFLEFCEAAKVPLALRALGLRALTGHIMTNPETGEQVDQKAGQLMGSIISFPVLCGVNAAVCRWAMSLSVGAKRLPLTYKDADGNRVPYIRLLINGDDCLFPINSFGRAIWQAASRMAGLEESVGKCYYSRTFANVNSTNFMVTGDVAPYSAFRQTGYVNFGLLRGLKRSGGHVGALDVDGDVGSRHAELLKLAPSSLSAELLTKKFLNANRASLDLFTQNHIPWFIPKEYGGVGLTPCGRFQPSRDDLRTCRAIVCGTHAGAPRPVRFKAPDAFMLHEAVQAVLNACDVSTSTHWSLERLPDAWNIRPLYLWIVFMMPKFLGQMLDNVSDPEALVMEQLRRNRRCWTYYARKVAELPPPFPEGLRPRWLVHSDVLLVA